MKLIYSLEQFQPDENPSIFLAGPTFRIHKGDNKPPISWRDEAVQFLEEQGFNGNVFIPEFENDVFPSDFTLSRQVDWEIQFLNYADVILFWIPRDLKVLPAFTTNIEFGEWMSSGKIVIGAPPEAPKNDYIRERCARKDIPWYNTLKSCVNAGLELLNKIRSSKALSNIWFTADTHFGNERTNILSKRPFSSIEEMDWTIVKNWNNVVQPNDIVYHLGDFGNPSMINILKGKKIYLVPGNYDKDEIILKLTAFSNRVEVLNKQTPFNYDGTTYTLSHEPLKEIETNTFNLFGHIHKLQMVKKRGLNVGTDCHHFTPIDMKIIQFYRTAILNHYDENVFCGN